MKTIYPLFILLFFAHFALAQKQYIIVGKIQDEKGKMIEKAKIYVDSKLIGESTGNPAAQFRFYQREGTEPLEVRAEKTKLSTKSWKYDATNKELLIVMTAKGNRLRGKLAIKGKQAVANAILKIAGWRDSVKTNNEGIFEANLPNSLTINDNSMLFINNIEVPRNNLKFRLEEGYKYVEIEMPTKQDKLHEYEALILDEAGKPIHNAKVTVEGNDYRSDEAGEFKFVSKTVLKDLIKLSFAANNYEFKKVETAGTDILKLTFKALTDSPKPPKNTDQPTETPKDSLVRNFTLDVDRVVNELEIEKQFLAEKRLKIELEINKIRDRLQSQSISPQEKELLQKEWERLESAFVETSLAYESAQLRTRNLVDSVKGIIYEKEQLEKAFTEAKQETETVRQWAIFEALVFGIIAILLGTLAWVFFAGKKRSQEQNVALQKAYKLIEEKNTVLNIQKEEISAQAESLREANTLILEKQVEVEKQNKEIHAKNLSIVSSINYASRIQNALLPSQSFIKEHLPELFIFFKPRDIVSGDFYWFQEKNGNFILTVADCTGHGVPGALMSMIGMEQLTEIVNIHHITQPSEILEQLHQGIKRHLKQEENRNRDGMDLAMIQIQPSKNQLIFAGAKNPLYYVKQGQNPELVELKGSPKAIGGLDTERKVSFENHVINFEQGETAMFYMLSDGYEDQFGGEHNRKFMKKNLKTLLLEIHAKPISEQMEILKTKLENWQSDYEQTDDILAIGFRWEGK